MSRLTIAAVALAGLTACLPGPEETEALTWDEAKLALDETVDAGRGELFVAEPIELSTSFTIGQAVDAAAEELHAWLESQLPCAELALDGATLTMDLGDLGDACSYQGHTYAGLIDLTVADASPEHVLVQHGWRGLTNGQETVDGTADVSWTQADTLTRHIVHELTWSDPTGRTIDATGDREQRLLDPSAGAAGGIGIVGTRDWVSETGSWHLDIEDVELLLTDAVPYTGAYVVTNPDGKVLTMSFARQDADTITVSIDGTFIPFEFNVTSTGAVY
jgi:hypothetical protein